jgi:serine/threonine-protein kinase
VEPLQGSVEGFRDQGRTGEIDYAFALFNLGNALRLTGRPDEAIPFLEERLEVSDYKRGVVQRELALAREQAGQPAASSGDGKANGSGSGSGNGNGNGNGKAKGRDAD